MIIIPDDDESISWHVSNEINQDRCTAKRIRQKRAPRGAKWQTLDMAHCWGSVVDAGPTVKQLWASTPCLPGNHQVTVRITGMSPRLLQSPSNEPELFAHSYTPCIRVICRAKPKCGICLLYKWADTAFWLFTAHCLCSNPPPPQYTRPVSVTVITAN